MQLLYYGCMLATKFSILSLYVRIFPTPYFRRVIKIAAVVCGAWFLASFTPTVLQCHPVSGAWKPSLDKHCISPYRLFQSITIANFLTDMMVVWLPIRIIWTLQLDVKKRLAVISMFGIGSAVCLCSFLRLITSSKLSTSLAGKHTSTHHTQIDLSMLTFSPQ